MMMVGFLVSMYVASKRAKKSGADEELLMNIGLLALVSGVVGARIFYVIHYWNAYFSRAEHPLIAALNLTSGGLEFYGGFLAAVACIFTYLRLKKKSIRWYMDMLAPAIMMGLAFGRIGCFLNGCCWGKTTTSPISVRFPYGSFAFEQQWRETHEIAIPAELILFTSDGSPFMIDRDLIKLTDKDIDKGIAKAGTNSARGALLENLKGHLRAYHLTMDGLRQIVRNLDLRSKPVYPTQLYSSAMAFAISFFLGWYYWRRKRDGMVIAMLFVIYPIGRFLIEILRADNPHDTFGLTVSQGISVFVIPLALIAMLLLRLLPAKSPYAIAEIEEHKKALEEDRN